MTTEELGNLGELRFGELCSQGSMVSNPAKRDVHGFDNLVQVNVEQNAPAHDLAPAPIRAFVQAKATQKRSGSIGIRLTNWQHMVADPEPWFVFVCEVNAEREVTDVFLVHVNEHWMEKALRRLRKWSAKGTELGSKEMAITYGQGDRLPRIHGEELRRRVLGAIGGDARAYRDKKEHFYATCGYSAEAHPVTVSFPQKPRSERLLEWTEVALGLRSDLEAKHVKVTDQRFDDAILELDAPASLVTLRAHPTQTAQLQLFNAKRGNHSTRVDIFSTSVIPHIPAESSKARLKGGPFSLMIDTGKCDVHGDSTWSTEAKLSWDHDERFTLARIGDAARTMMLMTSPETRVSLLLSAAKDTSIEFWLSDPPRLHASFARYLLTVQAAAAVARYVGLDATELASGELDHLQSPALLAGGIVENASDIEVNAPARPVDKSKRPILVVSSAYPIADWVIFTSGALPLKRKAKDRFVFTTEHAQNLGVWKVRTAEAKDFPIVEKQAESVERLEKDPKLAVFWVDPRTDAGMRRLMSGPAGSDGQQLDAQGPAEGR
jgi:hypothetical protein